MTNDNRNVAQKREFLAAWYGANLGALSEELCNYAHTAPAEDIDALYTTMQQTLSVQPQ